MLEYIVRERKRVTWIREQTKVEYIIKSIIIIDERMVGGQRR